MQNSKVLRVLFDIHPEAKENQLLKTSGLAAFMVLGKGLLEVVIAHAQSDLKEILVQNMF